MNNHSPISSADSLDISESSEIMMGTGGKQSFEDRVGGHHSHATSNKRSDPRGAGGILRPPPKRFKSSFIFFSIEKHQEYRLKFASEDDAKGVNITKLVAEAWRTISPEEKAKYEKLASDDKNRYEKDLLNYKDESGNIIQPKKRTKDPNAPKRPMSAFLAFANSRRAEVKAKNPNGTNGEISKLLSAMWKELSEEDQKEYREKEAVLWTAYREDMKAWRRKNDKRRINTAKTSDHYPAYEDHKQKTDAVIESHRPSKQARKASKNKPEVRGTTTTSSFQESTFEEHFAGLGNRRGSFLVEQHSRPPSSQEDHDLMAASAALRDVRGAGGASGSNLFSHGSFNNAFLGNTTAPASVQGGHLPLGFEGVLPGANYRTPHLAQHQLESILGGLASGGRLGGAGALVQHAGAQHLTNTTGATNQDLLGNSPSSVVNRSLLDLSLPYQTLGGSNTGGGGALGTIGSDPAVLLAQAALQGATASSVNSNTFYIPGVTDPAPPPLAAQLASMAAGHHYPGTTGLTMTYNAAAGSFQLAPGLNGSSAGTAGGAGGNNYQGNSSTYDQDGGNHGAWPHTG